MVSCNLRRKVRKKIVFPVVFIEHLLCTDTVLGIWDLPIKMKGLGI